MARRIRPWFRSDRSMWYATIDGVQVSLDVSGEGGRERATEVLAALLEARSRANANPTDPARAGGPQLPPRTVASAAAEFLSKKKTKVGPSAWRAYDITLRVWFVPAFGDRPIGTLTADEVEAWCDRPDWSNSTRHNRTGDVMTFLKWAGHPLAVPRPPMESRGADAVLSDEDFAKVLAAAAGGPYPTDLAALLTVLRETGARPGEVARLTAQMIDWPNRCVRLREHKTMKHGGDRIVHFNDAAMAVLETQRAKYPKGHLFRTRNGNPWKPGQLVKRMVQVSEKCGVHATAYMGRHTFATAALVAGVPDAVVASLLGHKGTAMVTKHYGHVNQNSKAMKDALEKMKRPA